MEELYSILTHKLKLINSKMDYKLMTVSEKDSMLDTLLVEKKKESLRILVQTRLQQAIATRHIVADDQIGEICKRSHQIMSLHVPKLNLPNQVNHISSIVNLFLEFFNEVGCSLRSQQIKNMYEKRLCPKSLMVATLFNWFVEWTRKLFKEFLKNNIHSLYLNSRQPIHFIHNEAEQVNNSTSERKIIFQDVHKKSIIHHREKNVSQKKEERYSKELPKSLQSLRIMSSRQSLKQKNQITEELLPINREVFLFAYSQQLQQLYRNIQSCIPDLEAGWARRLKRGSRRQQVLKRIADVAVSCIKQMPLTKRSIQVYNQQYTKGHPSPVLQSNKEKRLKTQGLKNTQQNSSFKAGGAKKKKKYSFLEKEEERHSQTFQINKFTNINDFTLEKCDQNRNISTSQQLLNDRKRRIFSSFTHKKRYEVQSEDGQQSNLLLSPIHQRRGQSRKNQMSFQVSHRTLDLSLDPIPQQQKVFFINEGRMSHDLQIIQERVKKMKARVLHGRPLKGSMSKSKTNDKKVNKDLYKSIENDKPIAQEFRRIANTLQIAQKVTLKLPKIKKAK